MRLVWIICLILCHASLPVAAQDRDRLRIAIWAVELEGSGPGVLVRDILSGTDPKVIAAQRHIASLDPDILLLTHFDTDVDGITAQTFAQDTDFSFIYTHPANKGVPTSFDLDQDDRFGEPEDAMAYGEFVGNSGMALFSKLPIKRSNIEDFTSMLWTDLPKNVLPTDFFGEKTSQEMKLSSSGHWVIPITWQNHTFSILAFSAASPVFDGDEDRNGARNSDEIKFWSHYLDNVDSEEEFIVLLGTANLDPRNGEGRHDAIHNLLSHERLQDAKPRSDYGHRYANPEHLGDPRFDTADWSDPVPGNLRVDYVLPDVRLSVLDQGIAWLTAENSEVAFRHGLVWVDIATIP